MHFGTPDLPRTLDAVLHALPPSWLPDAWTELMAADLDDLPALLVEWHGCASRLPTPEQASEACRQAEQEPGVPFEELIADDTERLDRWRRLLAAHEARTPEQEEAWQAEHRREQERRRADAVRFCEDLEKLAADQRRYLEICRQEREKQ